MPHAQIPGSTELVGGPGYSFDSYFHGMVTDEWGTGYNDAGEPSVMVGAASKCASQQASEEGDQRKGAGLTNEQDTWRYGCTRTKGETCGQILVVVTPSPPSHVLSTK